MAVHMRIHPAKINILYHSIAEKFNDEITLKLTDQVMDKHNKNYSRDYANPVAVVVATDNHTIKFSDIVL